MPRITKNKQKSNKKVKTNRKQKKETVSFFVVKKTRKTRKTQKGGTLEEDVAKEIHTVLGNMKTTTDRNVWVVTTDLADKTIIETIKSNIKKSDTKTKTIGGKEYEIVTGKIDPTNISAINKKKSKDVKYNRYISTYMPSQADVETFVKTGTAPKPLKDEDTLLKELGEDTLDIGAWEGIKLNTDSLDALADDAKARVQAVIDGLKASVALKDEDTLLRELGEDTLDIGTWEGIKVNTDSLDALADDAKARVQAVIDGLKASAAIDPAEQNLINTLKAANPTDQNQLNLWAFDNNLVPMATKIDPNSALFAEIEKIKASNPSGFPSVGGKRKSKKTKKTKNVRKHRGIVQTGGSAGRLRKGYKYTGRRLKNGQAEIKKVKQTRK